ncbi:hypothetical protein ACF09C_22485 [Streptomyces sp. NPDC014870]|uniref:hypothetical protein n=1 Tax=Streptomyces sp. NPDC014870 TaxID=3364925 RepID=UPI003702248F
MSRRVSLPGADELFRTTGGMALQSSSPRGRVPAPAGESDTEAAEGAASGSGSGAGSGSAPGPAAGSASAEHSTAQSAEQPESRSRAAESPAPVPAPAAQARRRGRSPNRRPSGRERHDEKITVYVSAEELMDLEHARLVLRGEHGLAVDRGRIVREAVAVVLADLESRGDASILVRRLRGR